MSSDHAVPKHLGIIMDGNRRWAKERGLAAIEGHQAGYRRLVSLLPIVQAMGIQNVTIYAFSTENWSRVDEEVKGLMKMVLWVVSKQLKRFVKDDVRIRIVGSYDNVSPDVVAALQKAEKATKDCGAGGTLGVCFNYGGQQEMADAVKSIIASGVDPDTVTPEVVAEHLYVPELPPLDLIIRTSGEQRLSGFMLWRSSYAELYFPDVLWPDFDEAQLRLAIDDYAARKRRFGV